MRPIGLSFGPKATAFLDNMPPGKLRVQVAKRAMSLVQDPTPPGCKKLHGITYGVARDAVWRVRQGDYRILYVIRANEILVIDIGNRKDVYK
jgi:mRNA interferase RelE/StbE